MAPESTFRLFLALVPPDPVRTALGAHARHLSGRFPHARRIPSENFHLTVCFIGAVGRSERDALASWVGEFVCPQFALRLDETGTFRRAGVVWAGCSTVPEALFALREAAVPQAAQAGAAPSDIDTARFRPHVSLLRARGSIGDVGDIVLTPPVDWPVSQLVLMQSEPIRRGVRYRVVAESRLAVG